MLGDPEMALIRRVMYVNDTFRDAGIDFQRVYRSFLRVSHRAEHG